MTAAEMPGIAPMTEPIHEQRMFSQKWSKQSTEPCHRPFQLFSIFSPLCTTAVRATRRSQSSGSAKTPRVSGTRGKPSQR